MVETRQSMDSRNTGSDQCGSRDQSTVEATAALATADDLHQFYLDLLAWIATGCPHCREFSRFYGLCTNVRWWADDHDLSSDATVEAMRDTFVLAGLSRDTPFNPSKEAYIHEVHAGYFTNPARLAWIKAHAEAPALQPEASRG